jgi:hypothetical protein
MKQLLKSDKKLFTRWDMQTFGEFCRDNEQERIIEIIKNWGKFNDGSKELIETITRSKHKAYNSKVFKLGEVK